MTELPRTQALRCFITVAREGTVSRAAAMLKLTQPAVSLQLKALEESTGLQLFNRTPSGFTLTEAGQIRVSARINGRRAVAIIDTGVSISLVSRDFARKAGMRIAATSQADAIGGGISIGLGRIVFFTTMIVVVARPISIITCNLGLSSCLPWHGARRGLRH